MGRHADVTRTRGLARWVVTAGIAVLAVAIIVVGTIIVVVGFDSDDDGRCTTAVSLPIAAGPSAARALTEAAQGYNETAPVVRSACVIATVTAVKDADVIDGFTDRWRTKNGPAPALWIADSAASLAMLDATNPEFAAGHTTDPFAWSPVVLAVRSVDADRVTDMSWPDLLRHIKAGGTNSFADGEDIALSLPPVIDNRASSYAVQSMLVQYRDEGPVDEEIITTYDASLNAVGRATKNSAATTDSALEQLAASDEEPAAPGTAITAVPVIETDLAGSGDGLTAIYPSGGVVGNALISAPISAEWTNRTVIAAANDFTAYLRSVVGQQTLADSGWRTISAEPDKGFSSVDLSHKVTMRPAGDATIDTALAVALGQQEAAPTTSAPPETTPTAPPTTTPTTPPTSTSPPPTTETSSTTEPPESEPEMNDSGPILTIVVDVSEGMGIEDDGKTYLEWVQQALPSITDGALTDTAGLWIFSDAEQYPPTGFVELISTGLLTDRVTIADGDDEVKLSRRAAFEHATEDLAPIGERWAYGALIESLEVAKTTTVDGRESHVILITSGVDDTPGTPRQVVLDSLKSASQVMQVDVIGIGSAVPADAYSNIATTGGGKYFPVTDPSKIGRVITDIFADDE